MKKNLKILGLIIARKGSRGLKNKNTKIFKGRNAYQKIKKIYTNDEG